MMEELLTNNEIASSVKEDVLFTMNKNEAWRNNQLQHIQQFLNNYYQKDDPDSANSIGLSLSLFISFIVFFLTNF